MCYYLKNKFYNPILIRVKPHETKTKRMPEAQLELASKARNRTRNYTGAQWAVSNRC